MAKMVLNSIRNQKKTKHNFLLIILIIFNASLIGISSHTNKEYLNLNNVSDNNPSLKDDSSSTLMISDITNSENESLTIVSYDQYSVYNTSLNHTLYSNYGANPPDFLREFITNVNFITGQHSTDGGNINSFFP